MYLGIELFIYTLNNIKNEIKQPGLSGVWEWGI